MNLSRNVRGGRPRVWQAELASLTVGALAAALLAPTAQAQGTSAAQAASGSINTELILDGSGSMAEPVAESGDQTHMAAAQAALREVIATIPEGQQVNVGRRVYGQEGSNAEADRTLSCRSTALPAPIDGFDRGALLAEVDAAVPTGWNPLARALQAAASDFSPGEGVSNVIIMVTDGDAGELSVVAAGQYDGSNVPVVVQNRTGAPVQLAQVSALARSEGNLVATGNDWEMAPNVVAEDGLAFGGICFGAELPEGTTFEFTLAAEPVNESGASELNLTPASSRCRRPVRISRPLPARFS